MKQEPIVRVLFFGDSICFGQGVSLHKGWVPRISANLQQLGAKHQGEVLVVNASANGSTTRQALERMPYEVQSAPPDVLIVQFGMNDCNCWETDHGNPRVSPQAFAANLDEIITRAFTFGVRTVVLNTNHPTGRDGAVMPHSNATYEQNNRRYNGIIREVASSRDDRVVLCDIEKHILEFAPQREGYLRFLLPDLLHLSVGGHDLYLGIVYPIVERTVAELLIAQRRG